MPNVDFVASSTRHFRDSFLLLQAGRYDNSFYHSGYVVECALKAVSGLSGLIAQRMGHRIRKLEGDALDLAIAIAPATARYRPPLAAVQAVSSAWSPSCRYDADRIDRRQAEAIFHEARRVWEACIGGMFFDGLIQELP